MNNLLLKMKNPKSINQLMYLLRILNLKI